MAGSGGAGGGGGERSADGFTMMAALVAGAAIMVWIGWTTFHSQVSMAYTYVRRVELWWVDIIGATGLPGAEAFTAWFKRGCNASGFFERCTRDFGTMTWREISSLAFYTNMMLLPLVLLIALRIFSRIQSSHPNLLFSKVFTVDSFVRAKKPLYRHLRMFDALDLIDTPLDHPVLGMSQTSRQFVFHNRLILDTGAPGDGWIDESDGSCTPVIDRAKTERLLRKQLGALWTGMNNMTPSETLVLAIAIPRVAATDSALDDASFKKCIAESDAMINWCWDQFKPPAPKKAGDAQAAPHDELAWLKPEIDLTVPRETIARYVNGKPMQTILFKHAYVRTVLFAMYTAARSLGVLPPAEMRWLRFYDRTLWYTLQNFGRQGAFAEGSAVHVHYLYEIKSRESLAEPQLDKAISALEVALTAFKYRPSDRDNYRSGGRTIRESVPDEAKENSDPSKQSNEGNNKTKDKK